MGKKHIEAIKKTDGFILAGIIDSSSEDANPLQKFYTTLAEFLNNDTDTDVVVIATPNYLHFEQAKKLIQHGYHVIIEKPFCMTSREANELEKTAEENGKAVFLIMQNRFSGVSKWLKDTVDSGILGNIYMVNVNCYWNRNENYYVTKGWKGTKQKDGGILYTQFSHFVDLLIWLFGKPENLYSQIRTLRHKDLIEIEDTGLVTFNLKNNAVGSIAFTTAVYEKSMESSMTIIAENGTVKIGGQYFDELQYCNIRNLETPSGFFKTSNLENLLELYSNIALSLKLNKKPDLTEGKLLISFLEDVYRTEK